MSEQNFQQNYQSIRQVTAEEIAQAQGLSIAELQKTQVLNLKEVEETVRFEKRTSRKPALIVGLCGILLIAFGTSFQIAKTVRGNVKETVEPRKIPQVVDSSIIQLECKKESSNNIDSTDTIYTITYQFMENALTSFSKLYQIQAISGSPNGAASIQNYIVGYKSFMNSTDGYQVKVLPTDMGLTVQVDVDYDLLDLTKLNPIQNQNSITKIDYPLDTSFEKIKQDMTDKGFLCQ